jgi:hypothetical protein
MTTTQQKNGFVVHLAHHAVASSFVSDFNNG